MGAPPKTLGRQVSLEGREVSYRQVLQRNEWVAYRWLSKWITLMGPYAFTTLLSRGRVMVWSPPSVITLGNVFPFSDGPFFFASVAGSRLRSTLWPSSICWMAYALSYLLNVSKGYGRQLQVCIRSHRNISTVEHGRPRVERVRIKRDIVSSAEPHFA